MPERETRPDRPSDSEMLDWLERTLRAGHPTEVFFAGLRNAPHRDAVAFQCEIQPAGMWATPYQGESLREAIFAAMQRPAPHPVRPHMVGTPRPSASSHPEPPSDASR